MARSLTTRKANTAANRRLKMLEEARADQQVHRRAEALPSRESGLTVLEVVQALQVHANTSRAPAGETCAGLKSELAAGIPKSHHTTR